LFHQQSIEASANHHKNCKEKSSMPSYPYSIFNINSGGNFLNQVCSSYKESKSFVFDGRLDVLVVAEVL